MALIMDWCDVEKCQLMWLRVLCLCERMWVRVLCMPIMCCCFIVIFNNMYEYGIDYVNYFALEGITKCELAQWLCFGLMRGRSRVQTLAGKE